MLLIIILLFSFAMILKLPTDVLHKVRVDLNVACRDWPEVVFQSELLFIDELLYVVVPRQSGYNVESVYSFLVLSRGLLPSAKIPEPLTFESQFVETLPVDDGAHSDLCVVITRAVAVGVPGGLHVRDLRALTDGVDVLEQVITVRSL